MVCMFAVICATTIFRYGVALLLQMEMPLLAFAHPQVICTQLNMSTNYAEGHDQSLCIDADEC